MRGLYDRGGVLGCRVFSRPLGKCERGAQFYEESVIQMQLDISYTIEKPVTFK